MLGSAICPAMASASPDQPGRVVTRQAWFTIPFQVEPTQRADRQPVKVQLHLFDPVTGKWRLADEAAPDAGGFQFRAPEDGEYSFMVRTLDRAGRQRPQRPPQPELIVVVDTAAPQIELTAERGPAGEVTARWTLADTQLDPDSFSLSFQGVSEGEGWQQVSIPPLELDPVEGVYRGEAVLPVVRLQSGMNLRAEVRDKAGNPAVTQARIEGVGGLSRVRQASTGAGTSGQGMIVRPASDTGPVNLMDQRPEARNVTDSAQEASGGAVAWEANRQAVVPYEQERQTMPAVGGGLHYASDGAQVPTADAETLPVSPAWQEFNDGRRNLPTASAETLPPGNPSPMRNASRTAQDLDSAELIPTAPPMPTDTGPALGAATGENEFYGQNTPTLPNRTEEYRPPVYERSPEFASRSTLPVPQIHAAATGPAVNTGDVPPQMVNSSKFELEYDIESVGPHGVRRVELWGTRDGGVTWTSYGVDEDGRSPLVATVEGEGMYGFIIAVQSGAGVGGDKPRPGEKPAIWVGVDKTQPTVELLGAGEGSGADAGCLVFDWRADDPFLPAQAVTLLYTEHPGGPWTRIATGLENTGHYVWIPDREMPETVYLRLEVRDAAGNVKAVDAPHAVAVRLQQPQGRVRNVRPVDGPSARRLANPYYTR